MLKIKHEIIPAREAEYVDVNIYDSFDEWKIKGCNTSARVGFENWQKKEINGINCYVFRHEFAYSDYINKNSEIVTEEVYKEILSRCDVVYKVRSGDVELFRKYCGYDSGFCSGESVDEVLKKLLNPCRSFMRDVNEGIDKRIEELEKELQKLKEDKEKVNNKEFLESKLTKTYELKNRNYAKQFW